jgi:hypothetical protein
MMPGRIIFTGKPSTAEIVMEMAEKRLEEIKTEKAV